jgi:hypothetical protein
MAAVVYLNDADCDMLMELDNVKRVGYTAVCHLRNVDKSVLMDTYVDKGTEIGYVSYDAWQYHSFYKIVNGRHVLVEFKSLELFAWVSARFLQLRQNICQSRHANVWGDVFVQLDGVTLVFIINKVGNRTTLILGHLLYNSITLWVYGRII